MIPKSLIKKVKSLEIRTRKIVQSTFSGDYHSAFKGKGINFSDLREYQHGDDIRSLNWKVSARTENPHVNLYQEERELTVLLMVDISGSGEFGSKKQSKVDMAAEIAAVLGFSAVQNSDKVGLLLFSDHVERYIPPKKGKEHVLRILRDIFYTQATQKKTDIGDALTHVMRMVKKKAIVFLISDFIDHHYNKPLAIISKKHDVIPIVIHDSCETELPNAGLIALEDQESGEIVYVNSSSKSTQTAYRNMMYAKQLEQDRHFKSCGCNFIRLTTNEDYTLPLMQFFRNRAQKQ